jgi:hypothetical protein
MHNRKHNALLAIYAALLHLYPSNFRRQFGMDMLDTFSDLMHHRGPLLASSLILREFFSTLFREHLDDPASLARLIRLLLCLLPPLAIYAAVLAHIRNVEEFAFFTFWLICILVSFWQTRCRGRECLVRTMLMSVVGMLLPLAFINTYQPMLPGFFSLAGPLAVLGLTVGLIFSTYARLVMEGLALKTNRSPAL